MKRIVTTLLLLSVIALPVLAQSASYEDRIYGAVTTDDGDVYEGFIKWDKNEASWVDILDGSKRLERTAPRHTKQRRMRIFGLEIEWDDDDDGWTTTRLSGIRMGHIKYLENTGNDRALLTLRTGQEIELRGGSTDIGSDMRGITIEDGRDDIDLRWRDIEYIEFMAVPRTARAPRSGERLYGTLTTRSGLSFTGYICWDIDEVLTEDILDGDDERGRDREFPFADIAEIARNNSRSARVTLKTGEELVLDGSNDVNSSNRDILVLDPSLGQVRVSWEEFDYVVFETAEFTYSYDRFYEAGPLAGIVETRDGDTIAGEIKWDDDEAYTWEFINGELDGLDFKVELGLVRSIERLSSRAALITLFDGREFELRGSNDVNDENSGIIIIDKEGRDSFVDWDSFERVTFDKP